MSKNNEKTPNSSTKRASRERFYSKLSSQRKMLSQQEIKDLRILDTLKNGFNSDLDFELSETDKIALDKHNSYMESESTKQINGIQSEIRLNAAISRGKQ